MRKRAKAAGKVSPGRRVEPNEGWAIKAARVSDAIHDVVCALGGGLDFEEKRQVLMFAAEQHGIDPGKLQGRGE